ncbi:MAG TPA: hypothetical protein VF143_04525 [Candidatus Nanopelagicales bacterium]
MSGLAPTVPSPSARRATRRSWWSLAATLVTLPLGIVLADVIAGALGYSLDDQDAVPTWVAAVAGLAALAVILAPVLVAFLLGRAAVRAGDERARLPMTLAGIGGLLFLAANLAPLLLRALGL